MKNTKNIFIAMFIFFMPALGMEVEIFKFADFETKLHLRCTCHTFKNLYENDINALQKSHTLGLTLHNFINGIYKFKDNEEVFSLLSQKCKNEHKSSFINYYVEKADIDNIINRDTRLYQYKNDKFIRPILENIVNNNNKEHSKYYIPYCNAVRCIVLLKKDFGNEYQAEWSEWESFPILMIMDKTAQKTVQKICSFFDQEGTIENFTRIHNTIFKQRNELKKYIPKAIKEKNIPILVFCNMVNTEFSFYDVETDEERETLAKANFASVSEIKEFIQKAIKEERIDKAQSLLKIYIEQGHSFYRYTSLFQHILNSSSPNDMLSILFKKGYYLTGTDIKNLTYGQLKIYVEEGYKIDGKNFWDKEAHQIILHKAVQRNDIKWIKHLLSLGAPTNVIDTNSKTPILYSLNNSEIFNLLVQIPPRILEPREKSDHILFYQKLYVSHPKDCLKSFILNNPEEKIIELFSKNFFSASLNNKAIWLKCAINLDKYDLFCFLFDEIKDHLPESLL